MTPERPLQPPHKNPPPLPEDLPYGPGNPDYENDGDTE